MAAAATAAHEDKHSNDIEDSSKLFTDKESSDSEISEVEEDYDGDTTEDDEEEEEEAQERRRSPYPRLQVWEEGRWSVSSTEPPSASSLATNGIHSSLNSQLEDEELASLEPHDSDVKVPEKNHRTTDSDNEEFCDSMEHLAMEEVGSLSPRTSCGSQLCVNNTDAACRCVSARGHSVSIAAGDVNEQIATALLRLQEDMADLLHRLHTLEVLTVSQVKEEYQSL
ncbi:hypothetical protein CRUP_001869 [Coryphaenoides rupestris]|nr:hypothetical protein CRUP_001869 [Coryphaenoides rupestris]